MSARVNGSPASQRDVEDHDSGPLPTLGVYATVAFAPGWSVAARGDYLPVDARHVEGHVFNAEGNLYYRISENVSAALGYRLIEYKVARKSSGAPGARFDYQLRGPQAFVEVGF